MPAGSVVRLTLENRDESRHSFGPYHSDSATDPLFVGGILDGPGTSRTYEFTAPTEPGEYFFRCEMHPKDMTGTFIVE